MRGRILTAAFTNSVGFSMAINSKAFWPCLVHASWKSARKSSANRLRLPLGRPLGLPLTPGMKRPATLCLSPVDSGCRIPKSFITADIFLTRNQVLDTVQNDAREGVPTDVEPT